MKKLKRNSMKLVGSLGLCCALLLSNLNYPVVEAEKSNKVMVDLSDSSYNTSSSIISSNTTTEEKNTVRESIFGGNLSFLDNGYGFWDAKNNAPVQEIMTKLKNSGIQQLRYPGGTEGDYFHWEETMGEQSQRKDQINCFSSEYPTYTEKNGEKYPVYFGVEELFRVCEEAGIKATIQLNTGNGTVDEAVSYVEWIIENQHMDKVESICIGNEGYLYSEKVDGITVSRTNEEYIAFCEEFFQTLRNKGIDPDTLNIGIIGLPDSHSMKSRENWDRDVLSRLHTNADFIDIHVGYSYYSQKKPDGTNATAEESVKCFLASTKWIESLIEEEEQTISASTGENAENISIQISECGPVGGDYPNSLAGSLYLADFYNMVLNNPKITATDYLPVLNHYASAQILGVCPRNPIDFGDTNWTNVYWDNCSSFVFKMYSEQIGRTVLNTKVSGCNTFNSVAVGEIPSIDDVEEGTVNVYYDKATGEGSVFVINKSMNENLIYNLKLPYSDVEITNITELWNENPVAQNTYADTQNVTLKSYREFNGQTYGEIALTTKPVSLVKIDFKVGNYDVWEDDFEKDSIANYDIAGPNNGIWGNWQTVDGKLQVTGNKDAQWYGTTCLVGGTYSDFIMEFDAEVSAGYGVFLRAQDSGNMSDKGLNSWFGGNTYAIMHWAPAESNASVQVLDYNGTDNGEVIANVGNVGAMNLAHWKIVANGGQITITITDKSNAANSISYVLNDMRYLGGRIGFYNLTAEGITSLKIDNLIITPVVSEGYVDNFSADSIGNYKIAGPNNGMWGNWHVADGKLQVTGNKEAQWWGTSLLLKNKIYDDFVMEFDADVSAGYGIILRAQDDYSTVDGGLNAWHSGDAYVIMHWAPSESNASVQVVDFNGTSGGEVIADVGSIGAMTSAHWKIIATGSDIVITITDNHNPENTLTYVLQDSRYTEGLLGFYNLTKENVTSFKADNLSVTPINSTLYENRYVDTSLDEYFNAGPNNGIWGNWHVADGKLQVTGNEEAQWWGTSLLTDAKYGDFVMEFDADVSAGYGVLLRAQDDALVADSGLNAWHSGDVYTIMHYRPVESDASVQVLDFDGTSEGRVLADVGSVGAMTSAHWKVVAWGDTLYVSITDNANSANAIRFILTDNKYSIGHIGFYNLTAAGETTLKVDNLSVKGYTGGFLHPRSVEYTDFAMGHAPKDATVYRKDGYIFSGWYMDKACSEPLRKEVLAKVAYAKYTDAKILGVKAQVSKEMVEGTRALRFVTSVDTEMYNKIGFLLEKDGHTVSVGSDKIYTQLYGVGNREETFTYVPWEAFSPESRFFKTYTISGIGSKDFDAKITAIPYWITQDGTMVFGESVVRTVNMGLTY